MASGRELCYVLLTGVCLCYVMTFIILARPTVIRCACLRVGLGLCLSLCYSAIFVKTNRISRIFNCGVKAVSRPIYTSPISQIAICLCTWEPIFLSVCYFFLPLIFCLCRFSFLIRAFPHSKCNFQWMDILPFKNDELKLSCVRFGLYYVYDHLIGSEINQWEDRIFDWLCSYLIEFLKNGHFLVLNEMEALIQKVTILHVVIVI